MVIRDLYIEDAFATSLIKSTEQAHLLPAIWKTITASFKELEFEITGLHSCSFNNLESCITLSSKL